MKILTILLISISILSFGQSKDSVRSNAFQIQRLTKLDSTVRANQKQFTQTLEFIFGCRIEDVESWRWENGMFKWKIKPKNK